MSHKFLASVFVGSALLAVSVTVPAAAPAAASPATAGSATAAAAPWPRYAYTDLGVLGALGGLDSQARAQNNGGQVAGLADSCPDCGPSGFHAILWTPAVPNGTSGSLLDLGTLPGDQKSIANGINDAGLAVGQSFYPGDDRAFVYNGSLHDLGSLPGGTGSQADGINAAGAIAGTSGAADGYDHAFLWVPQRPEGTKGKMYDLGTLPGDLTSQASAINGHGVIAGSSLDPDFFPHAFIWRPFTPGATRGIMTALPMPAGIRYASAAAINDSGLVVGTLTTAAGDEHAFLFDTSTHDLGTLPGGTTSFAYGINSSGVAVGVSETAGAAADHAVAFADGRVIDLNSLLPGAVKAAGVVLTVAYGINDHGQIAGIAAVGGHRHGFLLTPIR